MARLGGRQRGTSNTPAIEHIRRNQGRLEKILLDRALAGDIQAIDVCLRRIDEQAEEQALPASPPASETKTTKASTRRKGTGGSKDGSQE